MPYKDPEAKRRSDSAYHKRMRAENPGYRSEYAKKWIADRPGKGAEYSKSWRARNPEWKAAYYERARHIWLKKYGLAKGDYEQMLEAQGGLCAICGQPPGSGRRLDVDHDHQTGTVRGLLCSACNTGLGLFRDDPSALAGAIRYLNSRQAL